MQRVLIISPRFPPKNAPDLHRVRTSLPYYRRFGWEPTVLCLTPDSSDGIDDPLLETGIPEDIEIVRVPAWSERKCRRFGFGHTDYRSWVPLFQAGKKLLALRAYDVVFFSTTVFPSFIMGPLWKQQADCKVVYDFQDPWYQAGASVYTKATVPGSWWKYRFGQQMASFFEKNALNGVDHVISVSEGYVRNLLTRYPRMQPRQFTVIPFGVAVEDFNIAQRTHTKQTLFPKDSNTIRWVYVGRGGPDMLPSLSIFFQQLAALKAKCPELAARLRVHFVGTNYSPKDRTFKVVEPIAAQLGVGDLVEEHSERIPYFETLAIYNDCDAILLFGSNSGDYTASKFFNCVAARKPVLAIFHRDSLVTRMAERFPNVFVANFDSTSSSSETGAAVARGMNWLLNPEFDSSVIDQELTPWSAEELTRAQCAIFSRLTTQ